MADPQKLPPHAAAALRHLRRVKPEDGWSADTYLSSRGRRMVRLKRRNVALGDRGGYEDLVHDSEGSGSVVGLTGYVDPVRKYGRGEVLVEAGGEVCRVPREAARVTMAAPASGPSGGAVGGRRRRRRPVRRRPGGRAPRPGGRAAGGVGGHLRPPPGRGPDARPERRPRAPGPRSGRSRTGPQGGPVGPVRALDPHPPPRLPVRRPDLPGPGQLRRQAGAEARAEGRQSPRGPPGPAPGLVGGESGQGGRVGDDRAGGRSGGVHHDAEELAGRGGDGGDGPSSGNERHLLLGRGLRALDVRHAARDPAGRRGGRDQDRGAVTGGTERESCAGRWMIHGTHLATVS